MQEAELRQIPLLSQLDTHELQNLAPLFRERTVSKGDYIVYQDEPAPNLMFIAQGEAKVTLVSRDGKEIILAFLEDGAFFGEIAMLTGEDRSANVVAMTDVKVYILGAEEFRRHLASNSGLALAMLKELALRLRAASVKIGDLALFDVFRRVARTLKSLAVERQIDGRNALLVEKRPTHQELASLVGTSREMVTRALKGLEEDGCIRMLGRQVEVVKMPL